MDDFPPQTIAFFIIIRSVQITQFLNKNHHCDRLSCFLCDRSLLSELKCRICKRCTCKSSQSRDNLSCLTLHLTLFKHKLIRNLKLFASLHPSDGYVQDLLSSSIQRASTLSCLGGFALRLSLGHSRLLHHRKPRVGTSHLAALF